MLLRSLSVVIVGAVIAGLFALAGCVRPARIVEVEVMREVVVTAPPTATAPVPPPRAASSITPVPGLAEKLRAAVVPATASPDPPTPMATLPAWPLPTFTPSPATVTPVPTPGATVVSSITPVPGLAEKLRAAVVPATVTPVPPPVIKVTFRMPTVTVSIPAPTPTTLRLSLCDATMDDEVLDRTAAWMLEKVNEVREQNGLGSVVLDGNTSAQSHASAMLRDEYAPLPFGSETYWAGKPHVDLLGRDHYDRWVEHRGSRSVRVLENIWWVTGSVKTCEVDLRAWVSTAMRDWMDSPGHRRNLLDPSVDAVSLGFSWGARGGDIRDVYMVQVFVDY